jgi:SAM-dependent methyltransferase
MTDYWNIYYKTKKKQITVPSQFAAFAIQEFGNQEDTIIIDLGCGDGRDSYFFSSHGFQTIGIDGSLEAINNCKQNFNHDLLDFFCYDIEEPSFYEKIKEIIIIRNKNVIFYSRFFLHAINEKQQNFLINNLKNIMSKDSLCFFEFRTNRDEFQEKITSSHYRRYISPTDFTVKVTRMGFDILYFVEGFGYAKYRKDDAHIARFILKTN